MPAGTVVASGSLVSPGGQQGIPGPNAVSTDTGNQATFGSDSRLYVPDPTPVITSVRLRSFNAVGNPSFEVNQRNPGSGIVNAPTASWPLDRWSFFKSGLTGNVNVNGAVAGAYNIPGTNFAITGNSLQMLVSTQQATLAAGDALGFLQVVEGSTLRELINDAHSLQLLVYLGSPATAPFSFTVTLRSAATPFYTITYLCTITVVNAVQLITLPNIPVWASGNSWNITPGSVGYQIILCLGAGSNYYTPSLGAWVSASPSTNYGTASQSNFLAYPVNSFIRFAFMQHEPGPNCTTPIDKPFVDNLRECKRCYQKSSVYSVKFPNTDYAMLGTWIGTTTIWSCIRFEQELAKAPTITIADNAGTANSIYVSGVSPLNLAVSSATNINSGKGIGLINLTTAPTSGTAPQPCVGTWQADTGW